ncbi:MAG: DUF1552 domain-containing protein [Myxococcota bacterium]
MLRGVAGGAAVSIALPPLDVFFNESGTAYADGSALPRRFGWWFWGNGVVPDRWNPAGTGTGAEWSLSEQLMPLLPVKDEITVVSGMAVPVQNAVPHHSGPSGFLGGAELVLRGGDDYTWAGPSIDQIIAESVGGETRFRSLEVGVQRLETGFSHNGPDSINPPESNPHALFERLFGPEFRAPGDDPIIDPRIRLRRSVLDAVTDQSATLRTQLGASDRERLDAHLTGIRELERRLARLEEDPPNLAACMRPEMPLADYPDIDGRPQLQAISDTMSGLVAMALACDQTRVFSMMFTRPVNNILFGDATAGHHNLTHDEPGDQPQVNSIVISIIERFTQFVETLRSVPEGDGSLLDNCAVLGTTDVSFGKSHSLEDYPMVIAGSCCGALRQGIHYRSPSGENAAKVSLSLIRAMGVPAASFGQGRVEVTDGLGAIEL